MNDVFNEIYDEYKYQLDHTFTYKRDNKEYIYFGLVKGKYDIYFGMSNVKTNETLLVSAVFDLNKHFSPTKRGK